MSDGAPVYHDPVLHFNALRLAALRDVDIEETLATWNKKKCLHAHLRTCTQRMQRFSAGASLQPTPSPLCEMA